MRLNYAVLSKQSGRVTVVPTMPTPETPKALALVTFAGRVTKNDKSGRI
jgi:hypothetical protein